MLEHPGFQPERIEGRTIVQLRVRPDGVHAAGETLQLPLAPLNWRNGDPAAFWFGPDQWLLISRSKVALDVLGEIDIALRGQLHAATDVSSGYVCYALRGIVARRVLAMGCGIDMYKAAFRPGRCVRTRFAQVPLFIVATNNDDFDLYVERGYARYLCEWLTLAGSDPIVSATDAYQ